MDDKPSSDFLDQFAVERISVTSQQTSLTLIGQNGKDALAEQQAMVKAKKPYLQDDDAGDDPIGIALRQMHDAVASEALPDDFLRLLDEIDSKIATKNAPN